MASDKSCEHARCCERLRDQHIIWRRWAFVSLKLGHCLRQWTNLKPAQARHLAFVETIMIIPVVFRRWDSVWDAGPMIKHNWDNALRFDIGMNQRNSNSGGDFFSRGTAWPTYQNQVLSTACGFEIPRRLSENSQARAAIRTTTFRNLCYSSRQKSFEMLEWRHDCVIKLFKWWFLFCEFSRHCFQVFLDLHFVADKWTFGS